MTKLHTVLNSIKRDKRLILTSLIIGLIITLTWGLVSTAIYAREMQRGIAERVVRLHVLPNSNSERDQALKLLVRDGILDIMHEFLTGDETKEDAIFLINSNIKLIEARAYQIIRENGADYKVSTDIIRERFPTRHYEGITLPPGYYTALRIDIGEASGNNWWCIVFPPLCFVNATRSQRQPTAETTLQNILTAEQYDLVTITPESGVRLQARFRIVELWQNLIR